MIGTNLADILTFHPSTYLSGIVIMSGFPHTGTIPTIGTPFSLALLPPLMSSDNVPMYQKTALDFISALIAPSTAASPHADQIFPHRLSRALVGDVMVQPRVCTVRLLARTQDAAGFYAAGAAGLPLLIINGSEDLIVNGAETVKSVRPEGSAEGWKDLEVVELRAAGHIPFVERPEEVRKALIGFSERVLRT